MSLYRRADSPFYWSSLFVGGRRVSFSTGERTKGAALVVERNEAARLAREAKADAAGRTTLATAAAAMLAAKEADGRAASTVKKQAEHIRVQILPHFGAGRDLRSITALDVEAFKARRVAEVSPSTVCRELTTLRQVFTYARDVLRLVEDVPRIKAPRVRYQLHARFLSPDEMDRLIAGLAACRSREPLAYFALVAATGLRAGEAAALTWADVDEAAGLIRVRAETSKSHRPRTVALSEAVRAALSLLERRDVGRLFSQNAYRTAWERACDRAGLGKVRVHDLRHTFASRLIAAGVDVGSVRDTLGHRDLTMVSHYTHTLERERLDRVAAVEVVNVAVGVAIRCSDVARTAPKRPQRNGTKSEAHRR